MNLQMRLLFCVISHFVVHRDLRSISSSEQLSDTSEKIMVKQVLRYTPNNQLDFPLTKNTPCVGVLLLENTSNDASLAFKVKTTKRQRYLVRPAMGIIPPNKWMQIQLILLIFQTSFLWDDTSNQTKSGIVGNPRSSVPTHFSILI